MQGSRQDREAIATTAGQDCLISAILNWQNGLRRQEWGATDKIVRIRHSPCMPAEYHRKRQAAHHTRHLSGIALTDRGTNLRKSVSHLGQQRTRHDLSVRHFLDIVLATNGCKMQKDWIFHFLDS